MATHGRHGRHWKRRRRTKERAKERDDDDDVGDDDDEDGVGCLRFFSLIFFLHGSYNDDDDNDVDGSECRDIFNDVKRQKISVMTDV